MTRHTTRALLGGGALLVTAALALSGCGGSGFDEPAGDRRRRRPHVVRRRAHDPHRLERRRRDGCGQRGGRGLVGGVRRRGRRSGRHRPPPAALAGLRGGLRRPTSSTSRPEELAGYAGNGSLKAYGDLLENKDDFYPSLVENFTFDDEFYCAPKDFSTLALIINKGLWDAAGLTDDDIPTTWEELDDGRADAHEGRRRRPRRSDAEYQRVGTFMAQAGGGLVDDGAGGREQPGERRSASTYVQGAAGGRHLRVRPGRRRGLGRRGVRQAAHRDDDRGQLDHRRDDATTTPTSTYVVAELPEGPAGQGTLQFTNCWGMAADSPNQEAALDLVEYLTSTDQQLAFSEAFGPMPSIQSAADAVERATTPT